MSKKNRNKQIPTNISITDELSEQRAYVKRLQAGQADDLAQQRAKMAEIGEDVRSLGIVDDAKFVESMRDVGYKGTAFALAELIDNSIQAGAGNVHVIVHAEKGERVTAIGVMDDGHGMDPEMIMESVRWGGTHRHENRDGFGRFGMGKPSACVSQGRRFTSFSKPRDGEMHSVAIDLDEIAELANRTGARRVPPPEAQPSETRDLPRWVQHYREEQGMSAHLEVGTVVVIEKIDKADYAMQPGLVRVLLEQLGLIYRYYVSDIVLMVNGKRVEPLDPLFTLPGHRDPDAATDPDRARDRGAIKVEVKDRDTGGVRGTIRVRFSSLPLTFARIDKERKVGRGDSQGNYENGNARFHIMKAYNKGLHILRKGRQVDWVEARCPWTTFQTNDRHWGCEIDFDPSLDDEFKVTTSKQQVILSERIWKILEANGVKDMLAFLRSEYKKEHGDLEVAPPKDDVRRSEKAAQHARDRFGGSKANKTSPDAKTKADKATKAQAADRAKSAGVSPTVVEADLREDIKRRGYKIESRDLPPGSPFFTAELLGADENVQYLITINRNHRFFTEVYAAPRMTRSVREAIEALLLAIGEHAANAQSDGRERGTFYGREIAEWSRTLDENLLELDKLSPVETDREDDDEADVA